MARRWLLSYGGRGSLAGFQKGQRHEKYNKAHRLRDGVKAFISWARALEH
jgi:hypothetical protein